MLREQAEEWESEANSVNDSARRIRAAHYAITYQAAARDVQQMANEQADGSVPAAEVTQGK